MDKRKVEEVIEKVDQASEVLGAVDYLNSGKIDILMVSLISSFARREHNLIESLTRPFEYEFKQKFEQKSL